VNMLTLAERNCRVKRRGLEVLGALGQCCLPKCGRTPLQSSGQSEP